MTRSLSVRVVLTIGLLSAANWYLGILTLKGKVDPLRKYERQSRRSASSWKESDSNSWSPAPGTDKVDADSVCRSVTPLPGIPDAMFDFHMVVNRPLNLAYCFVPKIACTFWKRAFYFIQKKQENDSSLSSLFDVGKEVIHTLHLRKLYHVGPSSAEKQSFLNRAKKIIIVREPYSRLFSAWVDKLFLPGLWEYIGVVIVRKYRSSPNITSARCGHDVTFPEFLRYVVDIGSSVQLTNKLFDDHWLPISRLCRTCQIQYDIVGKLEDPSGKDAILIESEMDRYVPTNIPDSETDMDLLRQNIDSNWQPRKSNCTDMTTTINRLWKSFQFQGFLSEDSVLSWTDILVNGEPNKERFLRLVYKEHVTFTKNNALVRSDQRKLSMLKAYRSVSRQLLNKIVELFYLDFVLFGYKPKPPELFDQNEYM